MSVDLDTFVTIVYLLVDDLYQEWIAPHKPRRRGRRPVFADSEVLTLMLLAQVMHWSERQLVRHVRAELATAFPQMLSQSAFNRRSRDLSGACTTIGLKVADLLDADQTLYQIVDATPIPLARRCRGERHRLFADEASIGRGGTDRPYYYGCQLLLATTAEGVITGWVVGPASTEGRWLLDALLTWRHDPTQAPWTVDELPPSRKGRTSVGPTGPRSSPDSAGKRSTVPYLADDGFTGRHWIRRWAEADRADVITCGDMPRETPPSFKRAHRRRRLTIETVNAILADALHLKYPQARTYWGLLTRISAKIAAFNVGRWVNRLLGRPPMAIGSLISG